MAFKKIVSRKQELLYLSMLRQRNIRGLKVCAALLSIITPIFTWLDYTNNSAPHLSVIYAVVDMGLFALNLVLLLTVVTFKRFALRNSNLLFFILGFTLVGSQVFLLSMKGSGPFYVLFIEILFGAAVLQASRRVSFVYLLSVVAMPVALVFMGIFSVSELISPLLAVFTAGILVLIFKDRMTLLSIDIRNKNRKLAGLLNNTRRLKKQQDGDYYLTSLLTGPMSGVFDRLQNIIVNSVCIQKKKFTFRQWEGEVGGDLTAVFGIELKGRRYAAFLNADAMGKSMQGAGGAIVFGSVFRTHINRLQASRRSRDRYPEQWLKEVCLDLQSAFETFSGSMLVSAVFGVVDEQSGLVYYINAEHPYPVIYRDGKASMVDDGALCRKLGYGANEWLQVNTFQLHEGDTFIIGSDGKDDVRLPSGHGRRVINHDEQFFLRCLEECDGDINAVVRGLDEGNTLTDDVSVLSLSFTGAHKPAVQKVKPSTAERIEEARRSSADNRPGKALDILRALPEAELTSSRQGLHLMFKALFQTGEYLAAGRLAGRVLADRPVSHSWLLRTSVALRLACRYAGEPVLDEAVMHGERLRLLDPLNTRNLVNLAACYRMAGQHETADRMALRASSLKEEQGKKAVSERKEKVLAG